VEQKGFEPSTPTSPFHRKIVREFGEEFALRLKQQRWRDNHRHIFATLVFSPPPSLDLAFFSHGLLLSAASRSLTALLGVQSRVRFAGRPRAHRWSE